MLIPFLFIYKINLPLSTWIQEEDILPITFTKLTEENRWNWSTSNGNKRSESRTHQNFYWTCESSTLCLWFGGLVWQSPEIFTLLWTKTKESVRQINHLRHRSLHVETGELLSYTYHCTPTGLLYWGTGNLIHRKFGQCTDRVEIFLHFCNSNLDMLQFL